MLFRPLDLTDAEVNRISEHLDGLRGRLYDEVDELLSTVPFDPLATQVEALAFSPSDALPKRRQRLKPDLAHIVEQLALGHDIDNQQRRLLLQFTILMAEYYDIFDDVADGDVTDGRMAEVVSTWQIMFPLAVKLLNDLGPAAVEFWVPRAMGLMEAPLAECQLSEDAAVYDDIVTRQSDMFGFVTGLPAVVADADTDAVERDERIGQLYYQYEQLLLDCEQQDGESWSVDQFESETAVVGRLEEIEREADDLLASLPEERASLLEPLFAVDLEVWRRSFVGDEPCPPE
jgi:hypothetical protein